MGPSQRDSNPQGCGAEETRSVFQRSTRGPQARSGSGRRSRTRHPSSPTIDLLGLQRWRPFFFGPSAWDSNPQGCGAEETRKRFPAQHARAAGPKRKRAAPAARDIPHRPPPNWKRSLQGDRFCLGPFHGIRTLRTPYFKVRGQKIAKMSTATLLATYKKIVFA